MTGHALPVPVHDADDGPFDLTAHRRAVLLGAAVLVVTALVAVLVFGLVPYPDLPSIMTQPDPPVTARLAVISYDGASPCLSVVDGEGGQREVGCGSRYGGSGLRWRSDEEVSLFSPSGLGSLLVVDVRTGTTRTVADDTVPDDPGGDRRYGTLSTSAEDGTSHVEVQRPDGTQERLLSLDGPERYGLWQPLWSDDGDWVIVQDSVGRVLVVPADGGQARLWVQDLNGEIAVR